MLLMLTSRERAVHARRGGHGVRFARRGCSIDVCSHLSSASDAMTAVKFFTAKVAGQCIGATQQWRGGDKTTSALTQRPPAPPAPQTTSREQQPRLGREHEKISAVTRI